MNIEMSGLSHQGSRSHNEDSWFLPSSEYTTLIPTKGYLLMVADGVGGHQSGEVASKMAIEFIAQSYYNDPNPDVRSSLQAAMETANHRIFHKAKLNNEEAPRTMATTIALAVLKGTELTVANVGDSRVYLVSPGQVEQLTQDHSWVSEQLKAGVLTAEQAKNHIQKNVVTRSLGHKAEVQVDIYPTRPIGPGHTLILCSDGLSNVVEDHELGQITSQNRNLSELTQKLVQLTLQRGAPDNVTVLVARLDTKGAAPLPPKGVPPPPPKSALLPLGLLLSGLGLVMVLLLGIGVATMFWLKRTPAAPVASTTQEVVATETASPIIQPQASPQPRLTPTPEPEPLPTPTPLTTIEGAPPKLIAPENGAKLAISRLTDPIMLRWSDHVLTPQEQFKVFIRDAQGKVMGDLPNMGVTQAMELALPATLPPGQYSWLVVVQKEVSKGRFEDVNRSTTIGAFSIINENIPQIQTETHETTPVPVAVPVSRDSVNLQAPQDGQTFIGRTALINLSWSETTPPLAPNEYYVLVINHKNGVDYTWLKTNQYALSQEKEWLADLGAELAWQVVIATKRTNDPNENPHGAELSDYSAKRKLIWTVSSGGGGDGGEGSGDKTEGGTSSGPIGEGGD